ncbi:Uncharacterised protein [Serratia fonticola]|uniref:Uncharacterized protein n=1 Tax=Serratia fonticola TaxID=47917 RepID=A0A4U9WI53_SERFO|nr:Uncharacterised protein [Serratia fonticola]
MALRGVFLYCNAVMQQHGGTQNLLVSPFILADLATIFPHAVQVGHIMRAIIAL